MSLGQAVIPGNRNGRRGNGLRLCQGTLRLDIGEYFFPRRAAQPCTGVVSPFLGGFSNSVDVALEAMGSAGGTGGLDDHKGPSQPKAFCDSIRFLLVRDFFSLRSPVGAAHHLCRGGDRDAERRRCQHH